jgi:predicted transcriptional regulator
VTRLLLACLALTLLAAPALASPATVGFDLPAQAQGGLRAGGAHWAILLFHADSAALHLELPAGATATNHTSLRSQGTVLPPVEQPATAFGAIAGDLATLPGSWASLYVQADRIDLATLRGQAEVGQAAAGVPADAYLPAMGPPGTYRLASHNVAESGPSVAWQGMGAQGIAFTLAASGVRRLEWHNATLACHSGPCPASARSWEQPIPATGRSVAALGYTELAAPDGTLTGSGTARVAAFGGPVLDLGVAGYLRLPGAVVQGDCPGGPCPDPAGRTLLAQGNLTLAGLAPHPASSNRLQAAFGGDVGAASLDEAHTLGFSPVAAATAGIALLALPLLIKVLVGLFARSARPPALQHPKRQALYELIRSEPGLSFRAIQRRLDWPHGTLANHMARLLDVRLVVGKRHRNTVRFFENHGRYDATWGEAVLLRDPQLRGLHAWLLANPLASQTDVLAHCAGLGWRRSTTQDRLRSLVQGGLLEQVPEGRRRLYRAKPGALDPETLAPRAAEKAADRGTAAQA